MIGAFWRVATGRASARDFACADARPVRFHDLLSVVMANKGSIAVLLAFLAGQAALQPSTAWIAKSVIDATRRPETTIESLLVDLGPLYLLIMGGMVLLGFGEKLSTKMVEISLIITLQRTYLDRRRNNHAAHDLTQILYGCERAKKGVEILYKDSWRIVVSIVSVLAWQMSLGAAWIPLLLISMLPPLVVIWLLGPKIQRYSRAILSLQRRLAESTDAERRGEFSVHQKAWLGRGIRLELLKWFGEDGLHVSLWLCVGAVTALTYFLDLGLLPDDIEIGEAAAFLVNARLLAQPLGEIGKVYTKWREAYPAVSNVFNPRSAADD